MVMIPLVWIASANNSSFNSLCDALQTGSVQVRRAPAELLAGQPTLVLLDLSLFVDDKVPWCKFLGTFSGRVAVFYRCDWYGPEKAALQELRVQRIRCFLLPVADTTLQQLLSDVRKHSSVPQTPSAHLTN